MEKDLEIAKIDGLAHLDIVSYEREREKVAKELGIRTRVLDKLVEQKRNEFIEDDAPNGVKRIVDPWPDRVDGDVLLEEIVDTLERHVVLPISAALAIALWVLHSHAHDAALISPILYASSPTKQCGKTVGGSE